MSRKKGILVHAGDRYEEAVEHKERLTQLGWSIRLLDRSRTRDYKDTLLIARARAWQDVCLVEVDALLRVVGTHLIDVRAAVNDAVIAVNLQPDDTENARLSDDATLE